MKKLNKKSLALSKETVRSLGVDAMSGAAGGGSASGQPTLCDVETCHKNCGAPLGGGGPLPM